MPVTEVGRIHNKSVLIKHGRHKGDHFCFSDKSILSIAKYCCYVKRGNFSDNGRIKGALSKRQRYHLMASERRIRKKERLCRNKSLKQKLIRINEHIEAGEAVRNSGVYSIRLLTGNIGETISF